MKNEFVISATGTKYWLLGGHLHRVDGPAVEFPNGNKEYYLEGKLHRTDGPSIEYGKGYKRWFFYGEEIEVSSNEEFLRMLRLKAFW